MNADAIPVSIVTGFLGSGKTTMLRHLLGQPEFSRTAVIINEFGEIGLDHELIEASEDSCIELQTGCLCCKIRSDLAETLHALLRRRDEGHCSRFERIVIETSGLADPAPILQTLMTDAAIAGRIALSGVVTAVDAANGAATLQGEAISRKQVAVADRIILTKLDLAEHARVELLRHVDGLNSGAPILVADHGRIHPEAVLNAGLYDPQTKSTDVHAWLAAETREHTHVRHDEIKTYAIVRERPIPAIALTLFLEALAGHCGSDILRLKGIVNIRESQVPGVIHGVQHVFHPPAWLDRWPSNERRSRIVFITRHVPQDWIEILLEAVIREVEDVSLNMDGGRLKSFC